MGHRTEVVVIGGGQAGLAMSHRLSARGLDHVVLERGRLANRWRTESWDSLRLLTPRWLTRLPGLRHGGADPSGFMPVRELVRTLEGWAASFAPPLVEGAAVERVTRRDGDFAVSSSAGTWLAPELVIATGACQLPRVPAFAGSMSRRLLHVAPGRYRRPEALPAGRVLVVGASASGVQLADEIHRSGRPVTLAVGRHTRLPRDHRDRDILWWLDRMGVLGQTIDDVRNLEASRAQPSMQLVGSPDRRSLDLSTLVQDGVDLVGRLVHADGDTACFADDLPVTLARADRKLRRLLDRVDAFADAHPGLAVRPTDPRPPPIRVRSTPPERLDLRRAGFAAVVWATGYRRAYPYLRVPGALDRRGELRHVGGLSPVDGLYALGLPFLRRRSSSFLDGVGHDAEDLAEHIAIRHGLGRAA